MLALGGWDATGRAGLLADAWAAHQCGANFSAVATCLTVQGGARFAVWPSEVGHCEAQLQAVLAVGPVHAVKVGAVPDARLARWVKSVIDRLGVPAVIDPVVLTSRGEPLSTLKPRNYLAWAGAGRVLTPNRDELEWLGVEGAELVERGFEAVIVKGGDTAIDEVFTASGRLRLRGSIVRQRTAAHRGTGCRFATALAIHLARGQLAPHASRAAGRLVRKYLQRPIIDAR